MLKIVTTTIPNVNMLNNQRPFCFIFLKSKHTQAIVNKKPTITPTSVQPKPILNKNDIKRRTLIIK